MSLLKILSGIKGANIIINNIMIKKKKFCILLKNYFF